MSTDRSDSDDDDDLPVTFLDSGETVTLPAYGDIDPAVHAELMRIRDSDEKDEHGRKRKFLECRKHDPDMRAELDKFRDSDGRVRGAYLLPAVIPDRRRGAEPGATRTILKHWPYSPVKGAHEIGKRFTPEHRALSDAAKEALSDADGCRVVSEDHGIPHIARLRRGDVLGEGPDGRLTDYEIQVTGQTPALTMRRDRDIRNAGVWPVWVIPESDAPVWLGRVASVRTNANPALTLDERTAIGPRALVWERCDGENCPDRKRAGCGKRHPRTEPILGLRFRDVIERTARGELVSVRFSLKTGVILTTVEDANQLADYLSENPQRAALAAVNAEPIGINHAPGTSDAIIEALRQRAHEIVPLPAVELPLYYSKWSNRKFRVCPGTAHGRYVAPLQDGEQLCQACLKARAAV